MTNEDLIADVRLSHLRWWIALSSFVSLLTGFADSVAMAGLAIYLTSGLTGGGQPLLGSTRLVTPQAVVVFAFVTFGLNLVNLWLREWLVSRWETDRRKDLVCAYGEADYATQRRYSGAGFTVLGEQVAGAAATISHLVGLINSVARTLVYLAIAFKTSVGVSIVTVLSGSILVGSLRVVSLITRRMSRSVARRQVQIGEAIGDMVDSTREIHLLNRWSDTLGSLRTLIERLRPLKFRTRALGGLVGPAFALGTALVGVAVGYWQQRSLRFNVAELAATGFLLVRALGSAQSSQTMYQQFHDSLPLNRQVEEGLLELRRARRSEVRGSARFGDDLVASAVSLRHHGDLVVSDLDLRLSGPGGVALVGPSGSGKSTTLTALAGLLPLATGEIRLGGTRLEEIWGPELGHLIGLVPQDPRVLHADVRTNLTRPDVEMTDDELWSVLESLGLRDVVERLDGGLDAQLGRGAEGLSGGELQRLGLARLVVNRPWIWLLDEPTSALDRVNAERVSRIVSDAMAEHLVLVVTHRPELLEHCDRILYMEGGRLIDDGPLDAIARRHPFVARMLHGSVA
jgi:ABC-type multidrug transport system fused ATPase/permease subunit